MIKPIGAQVLIKIMKKKSTIALLPGSNAQVDTEMSALIEEVGTTASLGLKVGHEVMFKAGTQPVVVEETEDFDLLIVPEVSILYVKNFDKVK